jgi:hypothetical protein
VALAEVRQENPNVVHKGLTPTFANVPSAAEPVLISPHGIEMSMTD